MSRVFEALQNIKPEIESGAGADPISVISELVGARGLDLIDLNEVSCFSVANEGDRLFSATHPAGLPAERVRVLAAKLKNAQRNRTLNKVLITSAVGGDGKSMISANLAFTLASQGDKVLLVDGDLHQASLAKVIGADSTSGLADWWKNKRDLASYLQRAQEASLWFLGAGNVTDAPLGIIQSEAVRNLFAQLVDHFSWIIIDSPPLVPVADSMVWTTLADAVVVAVRERVTPKKLLLKSLANIEKGKLFGIVLNDAQVTEEKYYRGYYFPEEKVYKAHASGAR